MGLRRKARILAFQALFSWEINHENVSELCNFTWLENDKKENLSEEITTFAVLLTTGTIENIREIDEEIRAKLVHWDFSRLNKVDLAILRMSIYSLLFQKSIPASVTINEAVDIAKDYGSDDSYRFVNGVLDSIRKTHGLN